MLPRLICCGLGSPWWLLLRGGGGSGGGQIGTGPEDPRGEPTVRESRESRAVLSLLLWLVSFRPVLPLAWAPGQWLRPWENEWGSVWQLC